MKVYIDITQLEKQRVNTGIQRVVKEFLKQAIFNDLKTEYKVLIYNSKIHKMQLVKNSEVKLFLEDIKNFKFTQKESIDITKIKPTKSTIFFDIDSVWNAPYKRENFYPILKNNGFLIFNFIYDMIPIVLPQFVQSVVSKNFNTYIKTIYSYSDMVFFDSSSAKNDFFRYKESLNITREVSSKVVGLGSDFFLTKNITYDIKIKSILNKKYILFVGTLEPRKNQSDVLDAFDILSQKHSDLNLVFIGVKGWKKDSSIDSLVNKIESHPLKDKRLFWLNNIDDDILANFYQNAFIVTYLSKYEGYGLPIVESLQYGNITITSNNSSMPEVGGEYADYIENNNINQIVNIVSNYIQNNKLYNQKKQFIKENFKSLSWNQFSKLIFDTIEKVRFQSNPFIKRNKRILLLNNLKNKVKSLPLVGWFFRWSYNLLRLNSTKHNLFITEQKVKELIKQNKILEKRLDKLSPQTTHIANPILDDYYLAFENKFRGSRKYILKTYKKYLDFLPKDIKKSLDIGCGRAEWVQLLQEEGIEAFGIDLNSSMLKVGIQNKVKNLKTIDAFSYLKSCNSNSYDLITAFHIIEHIPYEKLIELLIEIKRVAKPDATILLETPNPSNLLVASNEFYKDPTHLNPLPWDVIKFLLEYLGFKNVKVEFLHPMSKSKEIKENTKTAEFLNDLLFKEQDYLLISKVIK